jgi:hypothetical protein
MSHPPQPGPQQPQLPPPKKRNGPLIGLLAAGGGLLLVVAVLFTGLVAPGFFLSEHEPPSRTTTPLDLLAVMSDDQAAAEAAACATGKTQVLEAARKLGASNAQLTAGDPVQTFENRMRIDLSGTIGSRKVSGELSVKRETDGNYCVSGVIAPS